MRLSLLISLLLHVVLFTALLYLFQIVPEMRLPRKIYSVKILRPIVGAPKTEPEKKVDTPVEKKEVEKPVPAKPKKEKKKKVEKPETKQPPKEEEKPLDVSMEQGVQEQTVVAVDAPRFPFSYYLQAIERKVSQNWFSAASGQGEGLSCIVYFRLRRNGGVADIQIEKSSGNVYYDRAALRAVRSSSPFPPLPRAFTESYLGIHFTFVQRD
ncbi:MAG: TonB family protein [bacterium]|nr:MAG: TonB family protein [bacterium]